jgi:hypothetical protein
MNANQTVEYFDLVNRYGELADGVRMIRRAVDRAIRAGVLSPLDRNPSTPLQECEAMARTIYAAAISGQAPSSAKRTRVFLKQIIDAPDIDAKPPKP